jgi:hypothetical protein
MSSGIAENRDHHIRGAVDDLRHIGEIRGAIDIAAQLHDAAHAVEIATAGGAQMCQNVQCAQPRRLAPFLQIDTGAELADMAAFAVPLADLPGDKDEIAGHHERHVIGHRRGRFGQYDRQFLEPRLDLSAHRRCLHCHRATRLYRGPGRRRKTVLLAQG